jgi:hypothetical protein
MGSLFVCFMGKYFLKNVIDMGKYCTFAIVNFLEIGW